MNQPPINQPQAGWRLHRSREHRMIAGVCWGLAETLGVDPLLVRIAALLLLIPFHVFTLLVYVALALTLPVEDEPR